MKNKIIKEIAKSIDNVFIWSGNANLFPAIINEKIIKVIIRDKVIINNLLFFVL